MAQHFGHCEQFALMDADETRKEILRKEMVPSPGHQPGLLPQWLAEQGVSVVIAVGMGDLTAMVVRKAVNMARKMEVPVLGVVENMSYFVIPDTGRKIEIWGRSRGEEMAEAAGAPLLGQIPLDSDLAKLCDGGQIERYESEIVETLSTPLE